MSTEFKYQSFNGHLIKAENAPTVYFVIDGVAHGIVDPASLNAVFKQDAWQAIQTLDAALVGNFPKGPNIDQPALMRAPGTNPVYLILSTSVSPMQRHWIISPPVFNSCKFDWQKVRDVNLSQPFSNGADIFYGSYGECEYITDVCIVCGKNAPAPAGYTKIDFDLRKGCLTTEYLYLCYKKGRGRRLTTLAVSRCEYNPNNDGRPKIIPWDSDFSAVSDAIIQASGGNYHICCQKSSSYVHGGITDLEVLDGKKAKASPGYTKINQDINKGEGGHYVYLSYRYHQEEMKPITQEWMRYVEGDTVISNLSIPATHDSAMWKSNIDANAFVEDPAWCQYYDIGTQFDLGVRGFDLRIYWSEKHEALWIAHGKYSIATAYSKCSFEDVFKTLVEKLRQHPTEFIIADISVEIDIKGGAVAKYQEAVKKLLREYRDYIYMDKTEDGKVDRSKHALLPTLDEVRGKIFIISRPVGSHGSLEGTEKNDPWRTRYLPDETETVLKPETCLSKSYHNAPGMKGNMKRFEETMKERSGTEKDKSLIDSVTTAVPYDGRFPVTYSQKINPAVVAFLRNHPELVRTGIIFADFIGKNDSLAWDVINVNPDIRKLGYE